MAHLVRALDQPKMAPRWEKGLWLGKQPTTDEHIVGNAAGIMMARAVRVLGDDDPELVHAMVHAVWQMKPVLQPAVFRAKPPAPEMQAGGASSSGLPTSTTAAPPASGQEGVSGSGWIAQRREELLRFQRVCGPTPQCSACDFGAHARKHTTACMMRRAAWMRGELGAPMGQQPPMGQQSPTSTMDVGPERAKRPREPEHQQEVEEEEEVMRTQVPTEVFSSGGGVQQQERQQQQQTHPEAGPQQQEGEQPPVLQHADMEVETQPQPGGVNVCSQQPPWTDEYTNKVLPESEVEKAMQRELDEFQTFGVKSDVDLRDYLKRPGTQLVTSRWLIVQKPNKIRARIVCQEVNKGDWQDTLPRPRALSHSVWFSILPCSTRGRCTWEISRWRFCTHLLRKV